MAGNKADIPYKDRDTQMEQIDWTHAFLPLLSLALQLESEGQYNLARLARAAADSLGRRAAYQHQTPSDRQQTIQTIHQVVEILAALGVDAGLLAALRQGAVAFAEDRLLMINDAPHPYVCRTCGHLVLGSAAEKCPICGAWPDTFQWFAPVYWFDALDPLAAIETLRQTPCDVAALLDGLSAETLMQPPSDGGWAFHSIVTHLRDAQGVLDFRLGLFQMEEHPSLESKAVFAWATNEQERPFSTLEIFADYQATRTRIIVHLESLPLAGWWRTGQHEEFGIVSLKQQVSYFAVHERTHLPQIEQLARSGKS